jgi:hypothetical protein
LAGLVEEQTTGNPFFAIQFISALFEEGLLIFDHIEGQWSWDLNRIHAKGYTDNVVDLMVGKFNTAQSEWIVGTVNEQNVWIEKTPKETFPDKPT